MKFPSGQLVDYVTSNGLTVIIRTFAHIIVIIAVMSVCQASGPASNRKRDGDRGGNDQIMEREQKRVFMCAHFFQDPFDLFLGTVKQVEHCLLNVSFLI